ncbi:MAG: hypothetical protein DDT30_00584 [Dehalococcoidia bacterium]|nr:hypothetical protein [Bacillota bacterium]MBT9142069.1 hypothetical protein [Bacillota bacterium]
MYDTFQRRVIFKGIVRTLTGLHIGVGRGTGLGGTDMSVVKDFLGRPFIPGSSFKGVLRSNIESFLRALPEKGAELACEAATKSCISKDLKKKLMNSKDPDNELWNKSCEVCRLFGSNWIASKVSVADMPVADDFFRPEWIAVRDGVVIDRETETAAGKLKYDFEAVPAQTCFAFELLVENPEDYQLGLLLLGLDFFNQGLARLGGITSRGLGRVEITIDSVAEHTFDSIMSALAPAKKAEASQPSPPADPPEDPEQVVLHFIEPGKSYDEHALVRALQQNDWTKDKIKSQGFENFRDLFQKMTGKGLLLFSSNCYTHARLPETETRDAAGPTQSADLQDKPAGWRKTLYHFLSEKIRGGSAVV